MTRVKRTASIEGLVVDRSGPVNGPVVVTLHGGGQTRHSWNETARRLADRGYHVLNYDARGHGESAWASDGSYSLDTRVNDLKAVLEDARPPFALIGASMGGATAIHAVAQGLRPAALILVDIGPNAQPSGVARVVDFMRSGIQGFGTIEEAADAVAAYYPERTRPSDPNGLRRNLRQHADGRLYWHWDPAILADEPGAMADTLDASSRKLAAVSDLSTLLVRGLRSDVVTEETVATFRQMLPALKVLDVAGAGHMVAGDRNDVFSAGITDFLDRLHRMPSSRSHDPE